MKKKVLFCIIVILSICLLTNTDIIVEAATYSEGLVTVTIDENTNEVSLSTKEKGTIMYAWKVNNGTIVDRKGNVVDYNSNLEWGNPSVSDTNVLPDFTDDVSTWLEYDEKTFNTSQVASYDCYLFLYTCVRYSDGKYSDQEYDEIILEESTPVVTVTKSYNSDNTKVTFQVSATDAKSGIKSITFPHTGEIVKGSSATFTTTENNVYVFIAENNQGNLGYFTTSVDGINIALITSKNNKTLTDKIKDDKNAPTLKVNDVPSGTVTSPFNVSVSAVDTESGIEKIVFPDWSQTTEEEGKFLITDNGSYTFTAYDLAGNKTEKTIKVENFKSVEDALKTMSVQNDTGNGDDNEAENNPFASADESSDKLPQTGGNFTFEQLIAVLVIIAACSIITVIILTRKKHEGGLKK